MKKSQIVMIKNLLEPLFSNGLTLDVDEAQMFFDDYKLVHKKEVEESKRKEGLQISMNLFAVSKKHLDCIAMFMAPFSFFDGNKKAETKGVSLAENISQKDNF